MQTRKKCEQCNTLNESNRTYCSHCGKYLKGKVIRKDRKLTIWGIGTSPESDLFGDANPPVAVPTAPIAPTAARQIVICPECAYESEVTDGVLPLSCSACGYFFQAGIDKVVCATSQTSAKLQTDPNDGVKKTQSAISKPANSSRGPLPRATKDTSSLRITSITSNNILPEMMKESGNVIGKNGTAFREFQSDQQISVWHTITGWYVRATIGTPLFNGVPMNHGVQMKLSNGDLLVIDQEQFMAEIIG